MKYFPTMIALSDIAAAVRKYPLVGLLGWQDVRQRYQRSVLGPFWLTISMVVMIATMGLVFGQILNVPLTEFLPFLTAGIIIWGFISTVINEGCGAFTSAEAIIKQLPIPLFVHVMRPIWRNIIVVLHNIVILPLVFIGVGKHIGLTALLSILGFLVLVLNLAWVTLILSVICTRYRDLSQIVSNSTQVAFYLTPIIWMPTHLPASTTDYLLKLNPIYHIVEVVRAPLLGTVPTALNWQISISLAVVGWILATLIYDRYKRRIAYWL
ncbi:ABC transporter permease [Xylella taiwanensis]|nr:ABC transporter permease [Xylella taiwanensis]MCD8457379.1 ABC transporter permease [Xylella taiwanensis]MCD8457537.1 ABC transporter permease [Xylella taiwanensis]MCD8462628.1 ABC transporter permease [Xylella taiwanensis]MCD8468263.1 ABC transporter permease [Xylella taiwanensis]MCD8471913.1 ABC transporter permease [Xylella taiwanensis]